MAHRLDTILSHNVASATGSKRCAAGDAGDRAASLDVAVVGAGFSGLYALHLLRSRGLRVRVFEKGGGVGGTWFWNRYPGAQCDIESLQYAYTFSPELHKEWKWTRKYGRQAEILRYLNHVADRFRLRDGIELSTTVAACEWADAAREWELSVVGASGARRQVRAAFVVLATGCLSERNWPAIPGLDSFTGRRLHTQDWPEEMPDFAGRRVGVIGTGSSGVQLIPQVAPRAGQLTVFQRTPNYVLPARNADIDAAREQRVKADMPAWAAKIRNTFASQWNSPTMKMWESATAAERDAIFEARWAKGGFPFLAAFADAFTPAGNDAMSNFVRAKIRGAVRDPAVAARLSPKYIIACKRVCVGDGYYEAYNRDNVTLVDLQEAGGRIERVSADGVWVGGRKYPVDDLICATGFDAMTGALAAIDIRGRGGVALRDEWRDGPQTYLGLACAGFPNMFTVTGPQSPSVLTNMSIAIEQHVEWIAACIGHVRGARRRTIEAAPAAQAEWIRHCAEVSGQSLGVIHPTCGNSWYSGANIEGKPRVELPYRGGFGQAAGLTPWPSYVDRCDKVAAAGYEGFVIT